MPGGSWTNCQPSSGIVAFTRPDVDSKEVVNDLREKKIIIVIREGRMRATPHFYNSPEQIDRLIKALP